MTRKNSHDQNFKNLILDYPRQALEFFAADEALDLQTAIITPVRQEQLQSRLGDRFHELDVPLLVEWPDGRREALLFVLEEETNPARFSIHRLAHYCLDLADLLKTGWVVPVVIFLRGNTGIPLHLHLGSERYTYLSFTYLRCILAETPVDAHLQSANLVARLNLPNMQWNPRHKVDIYAQAIRGLLELEPDPEKQLKYLDFIDIYTALDDNEMHQYRDRYPQENRTMTRLTDRLLEQGMQQGIQQGELTVLMRLLSRRFGPLDTTIEQRLQQAGTEDLERWAENVLDAKTLEEVFTRH
ncbi:DUF4351 domain-containing protein [Phytopseudomonas dryadis]|uniref:DUF4351 domain-containing protein n=1 Tax=Phytopseudomonas dryadis TaxID=2487520 RepID=A0A4Q9QTI1_9GAMM|nr:DUF4351 domain-containing protein [Pseudomonas dryadis]TBU86372.1 hypothetical protein DNK44_23255 [Pseudomonas dryadis]